MKEDLVILHDLTVRRWSRVVMYGCLIASGVLVTSEPSRLIIDQIGYGRASMWGVLWTIGAAICFYGALTDRWIGEYTGAPLLATVLFLYGFSALHAAVVEDGVLLFAFGLLIVAFCFGLVARWKDVESIMNASHEVANMQKEDKGENR